MQFSCDVCRAANCMHSCACARSHWLVTSRTLGDAGEIQVRLCPDMAMHIPVGKVGAHLGGQAASAPGQDEVPE